MDPDTWLADTEGAAPKALAAHASKGAASGSRRRAPLASKLNLGYDGQSELPSISDGETLGGFRHALQMVHVEHERELRAKQVRCDIELAALRLELVEARANKNWHTAPNSQDINDERVRQGCHWTHSTPTPTESEAPSFADVRISAPEIEITSGRSKSQPHSNGLQDTHSPNSRSSDRNILQNAASDMPNYSWDRASGSTNELMKANGWIKESEDTSRKSFAWLTEMCRSAFFDVFCGCCILVNSTLLGIRLDAAAQNGNPEDYPEVLTVLNHVFLAWFIIELAVRFGADGKNFLRSQARNWNVFDFVVVVADLVDLIAGTDEFSSPPFLVVRLLRLLRIITSLQIFRKFHGLQMLRRVALSLREVFGLLLWAAMLLFILIFIFSTFLLHSATSHRFDLQQKSTLSFEEVSTYEDLNTMFGSMPDAWYTLYKASSGGIDWGSVGSPLIAIHWSNGIFLGIYIFLFLYIAANVILSIIVHSGLESAHLDRNSVIRSQLQVANSEFSTLKEIFLEHDKDNSGTVAASALDKCLQDHRVRVKLEALGLEHGEAEGLRHLVDVNYSGKIQVDEFMHGLLRLKGVSRSIDFCTLKHENKRLIEKLKQSTEIQRIRMESLKDFVCKSNMETLHKLASVIYEQTHHEATAKNDADQMAAIEALSPRTPPMSP